MQLTHVDQINLNEGGRDPPRGHRRDRWGLEISRLDGMGDFVTVAIVAKRNVGSVLAAWIWRLRGLTRWARLWITWSRWRSAVVT